MPVPAPVAKPPPGQPGLPKPALSQFGAAAPGSGALTSGYNSAIQNLGKSLQLSQDTTSAQKMQLGQQLQNNQGQVAQSLTNRGLGNTTVANTMQQAPLQTYNMGMAQLGNLDATRGMQGYQSIANAEMQGGAATSGYAAPYAQTNYLNTLQQIAQNQQYNSMYGSQMQNQNNNLGMYQLPNPQAGLGGQSAHGLTMMG